MSRFAVFVLASVFCLPPVAAMAAGEIARGTLVVAQSTASADTAIKAARSDIARFEAQAKGMRPGASGA